MVRLVLAAVLAGVIGIEREYKQHPAGFRTHLLVGLGACLVMLMALFGFQTYMEQNTEVVRFDPSRLAAYVISGVGFLGAGTIIVQGVSVRGLTTAASLWVVAGIGLAIGAGMYFAATLTTIIVILSLRFLAKFDKLFQKKSDSLKLNIVVDRQQVSLTEIIEKLEGNRISVTKLTIEQYKSDKSVQLIIYKFSIQIPSSQNRYLVYDLLQENNAVYKIFYD
ncbi:MgtC/SapB family protein [Desertibacillus haloalkaliphilus]|nr:MgtC/SapB family protein [Desertibacillus haloalkaliphilus]